MKLARMTALEVDEDREGAEALGRRLRVELLRVLHQVEGERAPMPFPRQARREARQGAPVLEVGTEGIVVTRDELVAADHALARAGVDAPGVRVSRGGGRRGRETQKRARKRGVAGAKLEARVRESHLRAERRAIVDLHEIEGDGLRARDRHLRVELPPGLP